MNDPFAGIGLPTSLQCNRGFHSGCRRDPRECACTCHGRKTAKKRPIRAEIEEMVARAPEILAKPIVRPKMQKILVVTAPEPQESPKVPEKAAETADLIPKSELASSVADAVAFLDGTTRQDILDLALDEWAVRTIETDPEVKNIIAIRTKRSGERF